MRSGDILRGVVDGVLDPLTFSGKVLVFMAFYEIARPLYRVKEYRDGLYKLIKFKNSDRTMVSLRDHKDDTHHDKKLEAAYSRARSVIQQLALCNKWDYFFTATQDGSKRDRYNLFSFCNDLSQFIRDMRKKYRSPIQYVFIPEPHQDGAWHVHGFISGLPADKLSNFIPGIHKQELVDGGFLNWGDYQKKFGFCSLGVIKDEVGCAMYVQKYVTKDLCDSAAHTPGAHMYYCSRALRRAVDFGDFYCPHPDLDQYLTYKGDFCSCGWVRDKKWSDWLEYDDIDLPVADFVDGLVAVPVETVCPCDEWVQMVMFGFDRGVVKDEANNQCDGSPCPPGGPAGSPGLSCGE